MTGTLLSTAALGLSGCFASINIKAAQDQALKLETAFHAQMASGDLVGIYNGADDRYHKAVTREKSDALFSVVARKLGSPLDCTQGTTNMVAATWGTTINSTCTTRFSKDAVGEETFVWIKSGESYRLLRYNINSDALIMR